MSNFKEEFVSSSFFKKIIAENDVAFCYLGGSRFLEVTDEWSDYDVIFILNGGVRRDKPKEYLLWHGKKVHWYLVPYGDQMFDDWGGHLLGFIYSCLSPDFEKNILYINEENRNVYDDYVSNLKANALKASRLYCSMFSDLLNKIVEQQEIRKEDYSKVIYHLCNIASLLLDLRLDTSFLLSIKRIRWQPTLPTVKQQAVTILTKLSEEVSKNESS